MFEKKWPNFYVKLWSFQIGELEVNYSDLKKIKPRVRWQSRKSQTLFRPQEETSNKIEPI